MKKEIKEFCENSSIRLIENHMIVFTDIEDYSVGVLAEDTNYMIRNMDSISIGKEEIKEKIKENLNLLREWL